MSDAGIELKTCPACHTADPDVDEWEEVSGIHGCEIQCSNDSCHFTTGAFRGWDKQDQRAAAAWNERRNGKDEI